MIIRKAVGLALFALACKLLSNVANQLFTMAPRGLSLYAIFFCSAAFRLEIDV